jgi:hypothetical protein
LTICLVSKLGSLDWKMMPESEDVTVVFSPDGETVAMMDNVHLTTHVHRMCDGVRRWTADHRAAGFAIPSALSRLSPGQRPLAITASGKLICIDGGGNVRAADPSTKKWSRLEPGRCSVKSALLHATDEQIIVAYPMAKEKRQQVLWLKQNQGHRWDLPEGAAVLALWTTKLGVELIVEAGESTELWRWIPEQPAGGRLMTLDLPHPNLFQVVPRQDGSFVTFTRSNNLTTPTWLDRPRKWEQSSMRIHAPSGEIKSTVRLPVFEQLDFIVPTASRNASDAEFIAAYVLRDSRTFVRVVRGLSPKTALLLGPCLADRLRIDPTGRRVVIYPFAFRGKAYVMNLDLEGRAFVLTDGLQPQHPVELVPAEPVTFSALRTQDEALEPVDEPHIPTSPRFTWGALYVYAPRLSESKVRERVATIYESRGLTRVHENVDDDIQDQHVSSVDALGADRLVVLSTNKGWCGVFSEVLELAQIGQHPLAMPLSENFQVLAIQTESEKYVSYVRYDKGKATQLTLRGLATPESLAHLPELDLAWLAKVVAKSSKEKVPPTLGELERALLAPDLIVKAGICDLTGFRDVFEAAPLEDYDMESHLIFR